MKRLAVEPKHWSGYDILQEAFNEEPRCFSIR